MTIYPKKFIARVKAALMAGFGPKELSHLTGVPIDTLKDWSCGDSQAAIEPDSEVLEDFRIALRKEN